MAKVINAKTSSIAANEARIDELEMSVSSPAAARKHSRDALKKASGAEKAKRDARETIYAKCVRRLRNLAEMTQGSRALIKVRFCSCS